MHRQLLPDRLDDLARHYEKPKSRKEITQENYRIEDYLQGLTASRGYKKVVGLECAIPHFEQQLAILKAVKARFDSSLFDIKTLVQADICDSEIEAARELAKNGYLRASGAVCGVVLETHFGQVLQMHNVTLSKKNPGISDYIGALKDAGVIDTLQWRFIQHLAVFVAHFGHPYKEAQGRSAAERQLFIHQPGSPLYKVKTRSTGMQRIRDSNPCTGLERAVS
jgi:hypothetical protein